MRLNVAHILSDSVGDARTAPPVGTVTFLFTDIEGSTRLWEEQPSAMRGLLAKHDALLESTIRSWGGNVFKTIGDAFCAAFATAPSALEAALEIQLELTREARESGKGLNVRAALHTGSVELRGSDYFGLAVNRVARLLAVAHGGQTLLSDVARNLCQDALPSAVVLKSLGEHRLRDLARPETIYQLVHPGLTQEFAPLRTLDNPDLPNNLPPQTTSFIGRAREIEQIETLLDKTRLLTLTGAGGCGKSRLALQVTADRLEGYPDGAWLVELAALTDGSLVPQAVAAVLSVAEEAAKPLTATLGERLRPRTLLLVLDNCEHVLAECATLADSLLRAAPKIKLLVSSREALGIAGELVYKVPSLSVPLESESATPDSLSHYESVRLFIERAQSHRTDFSVTNANAPAVAQLCLRLDGIPLAIELAAARIRSLSIEQIAERLNDRFRLLTGGSRTALPRQQTLRALVDWSYGLLNDAEKCVLHRLAVFAGGWDMDAAESICECGAVEQWEVLDLLTSLADKSLVQVDDRDGATRFRLLETVRQYVIEKLEESGGAAEAREAHFSHFLRLSTQESPATRGLDQAAYLKRMAEEQENLRAALDWGSGDDLLRMTTYLGRFWHVRGQRTEGATRLQAALSDRAAHEPSSLLARAYKQLGVFTLFVDLVEATRHTQSGLEIARAIGDKVLEAELLNNLGVFAKDRFQLAEAQSYLEQALAINRESGTHEALAQQYIVMGDIERMRGCYDEARISFEASLEIGRKHGNTLREGEALADLGKLHVDIGHLEKAREYLEQAIAICTRLDYRVQQVYTAATYAEAARLSGDLPAARRRLEDAYLANPDDVSRFVLSIPATRLAVQERNIDSAREAVRHVLKYCDFQAAPAEELETVAAYAHLIGRSEEAMVILSTARALREGFDIPLAPVRCAEHTELIKEVGSALEATVYSEAVERGVALTAKDACALAQELVGRSQ